MVAAGSRNSWRKRTDPGPTQFSDRLRQRFTKLHRVVGRIYVTSALIAVPMGAYIEYVQERTGGTRSFTIETILQGGLWFLTTAIALAFILNGKGQQHRAWMTRSFGTGPMIFLEERVIMWLMGLQNLTPARWKRWSGFALLPLFSWRTWCRKSGNTCAAVPLRQNCRLCRVW